MLFSNKLFNSIACLLSFTNLQLVIPGRTWILLYLGRTVYKRLWACLALYLLPGRGVSAPGGCPLWGGCLLPGGLLWGVVSQHALRQTPPRPCGQTDVCKNITFATSLRMVTSTYFHATQSLRFQLSLRSRCFAGNIFLRQ